MNQAYEKIRNLHSSLQKEKLLLDQKIKNMQKDDSKLKSEIHHIELNILTESSHDNSSQNTNRLLHQIKSIGHDKHDLHENEQELKKLTSAFHELEKKITNVHFWMRQSEYGDPVKQAEALKHVFS